MDSEPPPAEAPSSKRLDTYPERDHLPSSDTPTSTGSSPVMELEARHTSGVYSKRELVVIRGAGVHLFDEAGNRYLDCVTGHGVVALGHCHPAITAALDRQSRELVTCPEIFYTARRAELYRGLSMILPASIDRFFLCNSGTEAVEGAFKFARLATGRSRIVAMRGAFHGRSMGALSATWNPRYRKPFEPLVPDICHVPFNDLGAARKAIDQRTAAVIVEPVQGEGGVRPAAQEFLVGLQDRCHETGTLLILDEVQTGLGRTGRMFAFEHFGLEPDLLCLGKALAGGLPMGALAIGRRVAELPGGAHGSTFGGNPLACAAALACLQILIDDKLPQRAAAQGAYLQQRLEALESPLIREIRGMGLMWGIDLRIRVAPVLRELQELGVMALPAGPTVLRLLPSLVISQAELDQVAEAILTALDRVGSKETRP